MALQFPGTPSPVAGGLFGMSQEAQRTDIARQRNDLYQQQLQEQIQQNQVALYEKNIEALDAVAATRVNELTLLKNQAEAAAAVGSPFDMATYDKKYQEALASNQSANMLRQELGRNPIDLSLISTSELEAFRAQQEAAGKAQGQLDVASSEQALTTEAQTAEARAAGAQAGGPQTSSRARQFRAENGDIVDVTEIFDTNTGQTLGMIPLGRGPQASSATISQVTANRQQEMNVQTGAIGQVINLAKRIRSLPDTEKGAIGSVKRTVRGAGELAGDVIQVFGEQIGTDLQSTAASIRESAQQDIANIDDPELQQLVAFGDLTEVPVVEALLAYAVARELRPDGRLDKDTIKTAKEQTRLTGFTSAEAVNQRLDTLVNFLENRQQIIGTSGGATPPAEEMPRFRLNPETGELEPF